MKVKIIKSDAWHTGLVGKTFKVRGTLGGTVFVNELGSPYDGNGLYSGDYEVVADFARPMKFRTPTVADSERIQRALFKQGARWAAHGAEPRYTTSKFIYVSRQGYLAYGDLQDCFDRHENTEYIIDRDGDIALPPPAGPKTKIVTVDGIKYIVPANTKAVTRDTADSTVFAWNGTPVWKGEHDGGWNHPTPRIDGMIATPVSPYTAPKPEGNLFVEVA